jgi:hypothetical protein
LRVLIYPPDVTEVTKILLQECKIKSGAFLDKAGWMFGVDPVTDPYFDITTVSDKFVELIENEIQERQEKENGH